MSTEAHLSRVSHVSIDAYTAHITDSVVRTVYHKYFHPKEVYVANGILNRAINQAAGKRADATVAKTASLKTQGEAAFDTSTAPGLAVVYPFGATLNVQKPAVPVLSSGSASYPLNRPLAAFVKVALGFKGAINTNTLTTFPQRNAGKIAVVASTHMFADDYMDKEENGKLFDVMVQWLTTGRFILAMRKWK